MSDDELEAVLHSLIGVFDGEEVVDEFSHALQCADNARKAGSDRELVVAALFHDVARSPLVGPLYPELTHELAGASWLQPRFGERVAWLVGAHTVAKIYLMETDPGYAAALSPESRRSAVSQARIPRSGFVENPWWGEALLLRRFDDAAKDPNAPTPDPEALLEIAQRLRVD